MTRRESQSKFRRFTYAMAVACSAVFAWSSRSSDAAWDGTQNVELGDQISAQLQGAPLSETHDYAFYAPKGTVLATQLSVISRGGGGLVPELTLLDANEDVVPFGAAQVGNTVRNFKFEASGAYRFRVRAKAGTGTYKLVTKAKFPAIVASSTTGSFTFDAPAGSLLTAQLRPSRGGAAKPTLVGISFLGGTVDLGKALGAKKFARLALPADATYTLTYSAGAAVAAAEGPGVDLRATFAFPRPANSWRFGFVETVPGLPDENRTKWLTSPHADHSAPAFNNWNTTTDQKVPTSCARCHTTSGYRDYLGADGTQAGVVDAAAPIGQVVECDACHNDATAVLTSVTFPSGLTVSGLGKEARCMVCHQGRESTVSVEAKIASAKAAAPDPATFDDDTVSPNISFLNVHYFAAGASLYGREAAGAYEYAQPGGAASDVVLTSLSQRRAYDRKFTHVAQKDTCIECHDPHTQQVKIADCAACHVNKFGNPVATKDDLHDIRMAGTVNDFNGNGDAKEGIWFEIKGLQDTLYAALQDYATKVAGKPLSYDGSTYPYFFEMGTSNKYPNWTARLLRAAYNYQYSVKDPGAFAHNGKFIVEFLYDSIQDLNNKLAALPEPSPVPNFATLERNDPGHFDSDAEPYRHWDEDTDHLVDPSCARCHSIEGFQFVAKYGIEQTIPANLISGLSCETCHVQGTSFAPESFNPNPDKKPERVYVASVQFPFPTTATSTQIAAVTINNGAKGTAAQDDSFICMTCHRARESKLTLDAADPTGLTTNFTLSFKNSHYLGAGATMYGNKAAVMYQYTGKTYAQRWDHDQSYLQPYPAAASSKAQCKFCHMQDGSHGFKPEIGDTCTYCHINATSVDDITPAFRVEDNYDNNPTTKPKAELAVFQARLLTAIQNYCTAAKNAGTPGAVQVAYDGATYPYFVKDNNGNGVADPGETTAPKFDTKSFRATFNYNFSVKEPGCWAHNPKYVLQVLYDAILDMNGSTAGLTRPN
jgi:hypothetical protein